MIEIEGHWVDKEEDMDDQILKTRWSNLTEEMKDLFWKKELDDMWHLGVAMIDSDVEEIGYCKSLSEARARLGDRGERIWHDLHKTEKQIREERLAENERLSKIPIILDRKTLERDITRLKSEMDDYI